MSSRPRRCGPARSARAREPSMCRPSPAIRTSCGHRVTSGGSGVSPDPRPLDWKEREMSETERDRILLLLSEGTLRPDEAAKLLAALADSAEAAAPKPQTTPEKPKDKEKEKPKTKPQLMEVQMQRPDGSHYTVEVPPSLVPMIMKM